MLRRLRLPRVYTSEDARLLALAIMVGLAAGVGVWLFRLGIEFFHWLFVEQLTETLLGPLFGGAAIILTLALAGLIVGAIMTRFIGEERHHGVAGVIEASALGGGRLRYGRMPFKAVASALSLGAGASVGPEDPSVQIGANLGSMFGQRLRLSEERTRLLVAAGAASAVAAAFNAPIAGVFFALEVILREFSSGSFGVVVLAAVIASVFTQGAEELNLLHEPALNLLNYRLGSPLELPLYVLLGLLLAPVGAFFIRSIYWQHDLWHARLPLPRPFKTALAGGIVGAVGVFLPQILGPGRAAMNAVLVSPEQFTLGLLLLLGLAKILMTGLSMAGGFVGGVFAPSLFVGLMLGGVFGRAVAELNLAPFTSDPQVFAIVGMAAMMAGVVRSPITAIMMVFELTNDYRLILPIMLAAVVCILVIGRFAPHGIYALGLARKGVHLAQGRDVDVMQGITVGEAMIAPAPTIGATASLLELRDTLRRFNTRALCVVDAGNRLLGIVTLADLQRAYEERTAECPHLTVSDIATRQVITAHPDDVLWTAIRNMGARAIGRLPVVGSDGRLLGLVSRHGVMDAYNTAIARKLHDQHNAEQIRLSHLTGAHVFELHVTADAPIAGLHIRDVQWPAESVVASILRRGKLLVPHGGTDIQPGDMITVVAAPEAEPALADLFGARPAGG